MSVSIDEQYSFFIDHENSAQNFCQGIKFKSGSGHRFFKAYIFVRKSGDIPADLKGQDWVELVKADTDEPEAADTTLIFFVAQLLQARKAYHRCNSLVIVKGTERGYGELLSKMQKHLNCNCKVKLVAIPEGKQHEEHLANHLPGYGCASCKQIFSSEREYQIHSRYNRCEECQRDKCACNEEEHFSSSRCWPKCAEAGCTFQSSCRTRLMTHDSTQHPVCEYQGCPCKKPFLNAAQRDRHYRDREISEKPFECGFPQCPVRFAKQKELNKHIRSRHAVCEKCQKGPGLENKHNKNCNRQVTAN